MTAAQAPRRVALLYPGDRAMRDRADPAESRFAALFDALAAAGIAAEPAASTTAQPCRPRLSVRPAQRPRPGPYA